MQMSEIDGSKFQDSTQVWLLPHPDDELFGLDPIRESSSAIHVFYFIRTSVERKFMRQTDRINEAISVWSKVKTISILHDDFANYDDGRIFIQFDEEDYQLIKDRISALMPCSLITPSFEGGHQDHDFVFAIARKISQDLKLLHLDFPTYSARNNSRFLFRVGHVKSTNRTSLKRRVTTTILIGRMALAYKSQMKSLSILFPGIAIAILRGKRGLRYTNQRLKYEEYPLYELRKKASFIEVLDSIKKLEEF